MKRGAIDGNDEGFGPIPRAWLLNGAYWKVNNHTDLAVLLSIAAHVNDDGEAWPSQATIARIVGRSERTVRRVIKLLVERGFMSKQKSKFHNGVVYQIIDRPDILSGRSIEPEPTGHPECPIPPATDRPFSKTDRPFAHDRPAICASPTGHHTCPPNTETEHELTDQLEQGEEIARGDDSDSDSMGKARVRFLMAVAPLIGMQNGARLPKTAPQYLADRTSADRRFDEVWEYDGDAGVDRAIELMEQAKSRDRPMAWLTTMLRRDRTAVSTGQAA